MGTDQDGQQKILIIVIRTLAMAYISKTEVRRSFITITSARWSSDELKHFSPLNVVCNMYGKTELSPGLNYVTCNATQPQINCLANNNYHRKQVRTHNLEFTDLGRKGASLATLQNHAYQHLKYCDSYQQPSKYFKLIKRQFKAVKSEEMCVS